MAANNKRKNRGRRSGQEPDHPPNRSETIVEQSAYDLPDRTALSLLDPTSALKLGGLLPTGLASGGTTAPTSDQSGLPLDPSASGYVPPDTTSSAATPTIHQDAPLNQATISNLESAGSTEVANATQDAPAVSGGA